MATTPVSPPVATTPGRRRWLGLRRKPGRLALILFRMPLNAYRHDAGWMLGHVFLQLTHVGRKTGRPHATVAMVLHHDAATRESVVCAGWQGTDWIRNLHHGPALEVKIGRDSFTPQHRFLDEDEAFKVAAQFRRAHPHRMRLIATILGWGDLRDDELVRGFVHTHPFVAFRPASTT